MTTLELLEKLNKQREQLDQQIAVLEASLKTAEQQKKSLLEQCKELGIDGGSDPRGAIQQKIDEAQQEVEKAEQEATKLSAQIERALKGEEEEPEPDRGRPARINLENGQVETGIEEGELEW